MKNLVMCLGCGLIALAIGCGGEPSTTPATPVVTPDPKTMMQNMPAGDPSAAAAPADGGVAAPADGGTAPAGGGEKPAEKAAEPTDKPADDKPAEKTDK